MAATERIVHIGQPAVDSAETGHVGGGFHAVEIPAALGDDIDHAEHGIAAIDGGAGAAHHFQPVDEVDVKKELRADKGGIVYRLIGAVAVHQQQDAAVVVPRPVEAAHADIPVISVVGGIDAAHAVEDVGQGAVAVCLDVRSRDDGHGGRRLGGLLDELAGAVNLDGQQLFD